MEFKTSIQPVSVEWDHNDPIAPTMTVITIRNTKTRKIVAEAIVRKHYKDVSNIEKALDQPSFSVADKAAYWKAFHMTK